MIRMIASTLAAGVLSLAPSLAHAAGDDWSQDFAAAKEQAAKEGKDLLMDFTGSDWCKWCIKLDGEVFSHPDFLEPIKKEFVLVKLDFPNDKSLVTPEIAAQNEKLQTEFGVQGFPTVYLADAAGHPYAKTGYQAGGVAPYLENLAKLKTERKEREALLTAAGRATGAAKAKLLDEMITKCDPELANLAYATQIDEIIALDADNKAGLRNKYLGTKAQREIEAKMQELASAGDWPGAVTAMEELSTKYTDLPEAKQRATFLQGIGWLQQSGKPGESTNVEMLTKGKDLLVKARDIAPETEFAMREIAGTIQQVEAVIAKAKGG